MSLRIKFQLFRNKIKSSYLIVSATQQLFARSRRHMQTHTHTLMERNAAQQNHKSIAVFTHKNHTHALLLTAHPYIYPSSHALAYTQTNKQ